MTDAPFIPNLFGAARSTATPEQRPMPQPLATPVLISDVVTPLGGETLLSLLMKRLARDAQDQP